MKFGEYAQRAGETAIYPNRGSNLAYAILGLIGEAGELANQFKKTIRDDGGDLSVRRDKLADELGDVLWYCAAVAHEIGIDLGAIAAANLAKLAARKDQGTLKGDAR